MRIVNYSLLTTVALVLCAILLIASCSSVNINTQSLDNNNAIARFYVGLSSSKLQREIEIEEVEEIISKHFSASTVQQSTGYYKGQKEKSLIVTVINCCSWEVTEEHFKNKINNLALHLRDDLGQESILVEYLSNDRTEAFEITD